MSVMLMFFVLNKVSVLQKVLNILRTV